MATDVQIPEQATAPNGDDLLGPLQQLLTGVNTLGGANGSTGGAFSSPAQSVAVIESGATALTKWWSGAIAALGGATAITAAVTRFWNGQQGGARIAMIATTGAVVAAIAIALAIIIHGDVTGRAAGAVAIYAARQGITETFLEVSRPPPPTGVTPPAQVQRPPIFPPWSDPPWGPR